MNFTSQQLGASSRRMAFFLGATMLGAFASAGDYTILPALVPGYAATPVSINASGTIIGVAQDADLNHLPVVWQNDQISVLQGVQSGAAAAINNGGTIVGSGERDHSSLTVPVLWRDGVATELPHLGNGGGAEDINDRGEIVGWVVANGTSTPAVWRDGKLVLLPSVSPNGGVATAITESGEIAGRALDYATAEFRPMTWSQDKVSELGTFSSVTTPGTPSWVEVTASANGLFAGAAIRSTKRGIRIVPVIWEDGIIRELDRFNPDSTTGSQILGSSGDGRLYGYGPSVEVPIVPMVWTANSSMRLPCEGGGVAVDGNESGQVVGYLEPSGAQVPVRWQMNEVEQLQSPNLQVSPGQSVTLRVQARRNGETLSARPTEIQLNGQTVATPQTNAAGVATAQIRIPSGASEGPSRVMFSLGGSRYIFRNLVVGRAPSDVGVRPTQGRPGETVVLRANVRSNALQAPVSSGRVIFRVNGRVVGQALSNRTGNASLRYRIPSGTRPGRLRVDVQFSGDRRSTAATSSANLAISR